jgi:RNA polymerase sigma factor (sigma-70 family)
MASMASASLAQQLGSLFADGTAAGLSDRQLLERFVASRDEAAFAAIVGRHGPMVLGVCRQLLGDHHHAEDAFQAVFLVLARQARSIRDPDVLGPWLHGVALRTARKARTRLARHRRTEGQGALGRPEADPAPSVDRTALDREQAEALHVEVDRLPGTFRTPVVLCYFEGLTLDEAARRMRWPVGTLRSRLARARDKLRRGLARRGVAPSAMALAPRSASVSVPPLLCATTTRAALGVPSSPAAALAQEVLCTMIVHKLRTAALSLCLLAAVCTVAGYHSLTARAQSREGDLDPSRERERAVSPAPGALPLPDGRGSERRPSPAQAPGRMTVVGRVLDPGGKPVPNASVMVYGALKNPGRQDRFGGMAPAGLGHATVDGSARFRLDMPRISSSTHFEVGAVAVSPGYGAGWVALDVDADQPTTDITLRPEQIIEGRFFDVQGQPVRSVRVSVEAIGHPDRSPGGARADFVKGPFFWAGDGAKDLPGWPRPVVTGAGGRFTIRGIGRGVRALLMAEDPRFARQRIVVDTDGTAGTKSLNLALEPARVVRGRITYADTGKPIPHASLEVVAFRGGGGYTSPFEADAEGNYRANPFSADEYAVNVFGPDGQPYLNTTTGTISWPKGALEHRVDLTLARGAILRGQVTEAGTGRPVAGAMLGFVGRRNPNSESGPWNGFAATGPDGSYRFPVRPEPGTLIVLGPTEDYVLQEMSREQITEGRPGGMRWYAHASIPCDLKPGTDSREVNVTLRRGATVKARVLDPDGRPVRSARVLSRAILLPQPVPWRWFWGQTHGDVRDGRFELHGLAPDAEVPAYFLDPEHQLGALAVFSVPAAKDGPITVRLQPCGLAMARLVDRTGKPLAGHRDPYLIAMVVTPGPDRLSDAEADRDRLAADQDYLSRIDPDHYADLITDARGRVTFPALIPGATYRVYDRTAGNNGRRQVRREFVAASGAAIELGDIVIEKPDS